MKTINFGEKKPLVQMKVNELIKFGNENKSSIRLILKTGTLIRHEFGRNTVERTKEKTLPKMKDGMADLIDVKQVKTVRQRKGKETIVETLPLLPTSRDFVPRQVLTPSETDIIIALDDSADLIKVRICYQL